MSPRFLPKSPPRLLIGMTLLFYLPALCCHYGVDDYYLIRTARSPLEVPTVILFFADRFLSYKFLYFALRPVLGEAAFLHHCVTLGLHAANAGLVALFARRLGAKAEVAACAAALFLFHPAVFTTVAFVGVGYNEEPALLLSLVAALSYLRFLGTGRLRFLLPCYAAFVLAVSFKTQALMAPLFFALGAAFARPRRVRWPWALAALAPAALFDLWFALVAMASSPHFQNPAYARSYAPRVLAEGYLLTLFSAINPLPVLRVGMGYQMAIPARLSLAGHWGVGLATMAIAAVVFGSLAAAAKERRATLVAALWAAVLVLTWFNAAMPQHRYEYYLYYASPCFCVALAYLLQPLYAAASGLWTTAGRGVRGAAGGALLVLAGAAGALLFDRNAFVRQAWNARQISAHVLTYPPGPRRFHFLRPSENAYNDSVYGLAIKSVPGREGVQLSYADRDPPLKDAEDLLFLQAPAGDWDELHTIDTAEDTHDRATAPLVAGKIVQTFRARHDALDGVWLLVGTHQRVNACRLAVSLVADEGARVLATTTTPCAELVDNAYHYFRFAEPVSGVLGKDLGVEVRADDAGEKDAVSLYYQSAPSQPEVFPALLPFTWLGRSATASSEPGGVLTFAVTAAKGGEGCGIPAEKRERLCAFPALYRIVNSAWEP